MWGNRRVVCACLLTLSLWPLKSKCQLLFYTVNLFLYSDSFWSCVTYYCRLMQVILTWSQNQIYRAELQLTLWGKAERPPCPLCSGRGTLEHLLCSCPKSLGEGRYCWRHNQVLKTVTESLSLAITHGNNKARQVNVWHLPRQLKQPSRALGGMLTTAQGLINPGWVAWARVCDLKHPMNPGYITDGASKGICWMYHSPVGLVLPVTARNRLVNNRE